MKEREKNGGKWLSTMMLGMAMVATFGAGYYVRAGGDAIPAPKSERTPVTDLARLADTQIMSVTGKPRSYKPDLGMYETIAEVRTAVRQNFVRTKVTDQELTEGAVRGMLRSLGDRFTRYLSPDDYEKFNEQTNAEFVGIGARLDLKDDYLGSSNAKPLGAARPYIVETMPNSPAQKAGLKKNDIILAINGRNTADITADAAVNFIRGVEGTTVTLKVERNIAGANTTARDATRDSAFKILDIPILRGKIEVHPVTLEYLPGRIAWLRLDEFNKKSEDEIAKALKGLKRGPDGNGPAKGLILDLRDNPGGLLDSAVEIGSHFIPSGPIVYTRERSGKELPYNADPKLFLNLRIPTVVLINNYSASAAEIVTGALKDKKLATVVGESSFGKASVQVLVELKNGGALVLTTAKYLTPSKHDISDKGISPDIAVKASAGDEKDGRGAQLQKAVAIIEGKPDATTIAARTE